MDKIHIIQVVKGQNRLTLQLKRGREIIDYEDLTIDHNLDTLLIRTIDKILDRNNMDRLSLKTLKIQGEVDCETVLGMILQTVRGAIKL